MCGSLGAGNRCFSDEGPDGRVSVVALTFRKVLLFFVLKVLEARAGMSHVEQVRHCTLPGGARPFTVPSIGNT